MSTSKGKVTLRCDAKGCEEEHVSEHGAHPGGWVSVTVYYESGHYTHHRDKDYCPTHAGTVAVFEADSDEVAKMRKLYNAFVETFGLHTTPGDIKASLDYHTAAEERDAKAAMGRQEELFVGMTDALRDVANALRGGAL